MWEGSTLLLLCGRRGPLGEQEVLVSVQPPLRPAWAPTANRPTPSRTSDPALDCIVLYYLLRPPHSRSSPPPIYTRHPALLSLAAAASPRVERRPG